MFLINPLSSILIFNDFSVGGASGYNILVQTTDRNASWSSVGYCTSVRNDRIVVVRSFSVSVRESPPPPRKKNKMKERKPL